jgi:hypothetical protein
MCVLNSYKLSVPCPSDLGELLNEENKEKSRRVMQSMLQMDKLDINALKRA